MEKFVHEDQKPQPKVETCPTPNNPPTSPLNSTQFALAPDLPTPSQPLLSHVQKHDTDDDDDKYFNSFPPGYKFIPDDDDVIVHYLNNKIQNLPLPRNKIVDVKLYEHNPKELAERYEHYGSKVKEKKWYFFTPRDRKYKNGKRPNRAAGNGYWKATGADKKVKHKGKVVGFRKSLVFYVGKPPKGNKTNWIMHEFRVSDSPKPKINGIHDMKLDDWVLCSIHEKDGRLASKKRQQEDSGCNIDEDDAENGNDNDNNLMVPAYDDDPSFPEPYSQCMFGYPVSSPTSFNPFLNFGNNQLVEDINNQHDYVNSNFGNFGGNLISPYSPLRPLWNYNPANESPFQPHSILHEEVIYGGQFDELDTSTLMSIPFPGGPPNSSYKSSENPLVQPTRIVENFHNSLVQPIRIAQNSDDSVVQPTITTADESPVQTFTSEK